MTYRAVMVGATGAVGGALLRHLLASTECAGVVAITRRPVNLGESPKLRTEVADFASLESATERLAASCDQAFCTVGVGQPRKVSREEFWRVDVEYAGAFARGARAAGARHISLLSAVGTNAASRNFYVRVKGAAEEAVAKAGVPRTSLFRPSLLVTDQLRYGLQDRVTQAVFPLVAPLLPARFHHIHVDDLARAMQLNAERPGPAGVAVLHYQDFMALLRQVRPGVSEG